MFNVGEGNDYSPISQSYEVRKLRDENKRLRERLQQANLPTSDDEREHDGPGERVSRAASSRASAGRQRRFKTQDRNDNIYFGTPALATVVDEVRSPSLSLHLDQ